MFYRFAFAALFTIASAVAALGQADQAARQKTNNQNAVPAQNAVDKRPPEQKWVEDSIDKFFAIPSEIFNPQPTRR